MSNIPSVSQATTNVVPMNPTAPSSGMTFALEGFLADRETPTFEQIEIERLVTTGKMQLAYDMYLTTLPDDIAPEDFNEFVINNL